MKKIKTLAGMMLLFYAGCILLSCKKDEPAKPHNEEAQKLFKDKLIMTRQ